MAHLGGFRAGDGQFAHPPRRPVASGIAWEHGRRGDSTDDTPFRALGATITLFVAGASLTILEGAATAAFPGSNGAIAYVCGTEICVGNVDGTNQRQLTTGQSFGNDHPAWSPDGTKIAFERREGSQCCTDIYVMNANGNSLRQVTATPATESGPAWSPDGSKLVYSSDNGQQAQLFVVTLSTLAAQPLPGTVDGFAPAWSPDGSKIAFSSYADDDSNCEAGPCVATAEIFVVPASGGSPLNLTEHNEAHDLFPNWSPNSQKIVFERRPHPNDTLGRMLWMDAGGEHDFDAAGDGNDPAVAPNGQAIVYDRDGTIQTVSPPVGDQEGVPNVTPLHGLHPDWQPCLNNVCPSTAATAQTQSTTAVTAKRVKKKIKASGTLTPPHPGATMTVTLFKKKAGVFTAVKSTAPAIASDGKFATSFKRPGKGQCQVTARFDGDDDHTASEATKPLKC